MSDKSSGYQPLPGLHGEGAPPQDPSGYSPKVGEACLYMERGGVNWCACHIICEYNGLIWIHNFYTGAHPVKRRDRILFKPMPRGLLGVVE